MALFVRANESKDWKDVNSNSSGVSSNPKLMSVRILLHAPFYKAVQQDFCCT